MLLHRDDLHTKLLLFTSPLIWQSEGWELWGFCGGSMSWITAAASSDYAEGHLVSMERLRGEG